MRGFGQVVTAALTKKMAKDYFDDVEKIQASIADIESGNKTLNEIKQSDEFQVLKSLMSADKHVVSGVFGKEIILQILAQKNCEGIRYILGKDENGKVTLILIGVQEVENTKGSNIAPSEPVGPKNFYMMDTAFDRTDPINGEVHVSGKSIADMRLMFDGVAQNAGNPDHPSQMVFSSY